MSDRVASIDFGTNTARLLIADLCDDGSIEYVHIEREIVRMGGGFSPQRGLSDEAMQRGLNCLERFAELLKANAVPSLRAAATSAVRDAANGKDFVAKVFRQTGILLEIIDGETEGACTLAGVLAGLDCFTDNLMVFDVGGGSTEYTLSHCGKASYIRSLPLGVVRLTEGKAGPDEMAAKINRELDLLISDLELSGQVISPDTILIGTAGTATTLAAISMKMTDYDYRRVNNSLLTREEIQHIYSMLLPLSLEQRLSVPGLEKGREDLIIAGTLITLITMERFGFSSLKVSDFGLLEGLVVADRFPS